MKMMPHLIRTSILAFVVFIFPWASKAAPCRRRCGDIDVPYPFGLLEDGEPCFFNETYAVDCNHTAPYPSGLTQDEIDCYFNGTYCNHTVPYWQLSEYNFPISNISLEDHGLRTLFYVSQDCYSASRDNTDTATAIGPSIRVPIFPISSTKNKFTAIGCDTYAVMSSNTTDYGDDYKTGCLTTCSALGLQSVENGSCSGTGCCQASIPQDAYTSLISLSSFNNYRDVIEFNNCSYAFIAANDFFNFSTEYLSSFNYGRVPIVLDWSVGNGTCKEAEMEKESFMCKDNSTCFDADNGRGYRCRCWDGYQGNPYEGCQDIDECKDTASHCDVNARCYNTGGNFTCLCRKGYHGDGRKSGTGCIRKISPIQNITLGVSISISFLLLLCFWLYCGLKQRKIIKQRKEFFQQNGGLMLPKLLAKHNASMESTRIFTDAELRKATNNYHKSTILGQGGQGTVFKGELNNEVVAIKKSKLVEPTQAKEFLNEVVLLTQINHRNVVKLIGCCLETEIPLLVYKFIANGTLFDHIRNKGHQAHMSWRNRLRIAVETAGALSYLHNDANTQIIHRDIKTTNILLDDNYTAKISDFGASRLVPNDQAQVATLVQGTFGYLDPECLSGVGLTNKSDVYSFGVVLAELITGREAYSSTRQERERSLSMYFVSKYNEEKLIEIIDENILQDEFVKEIREVAKLATRCLRMRSEERPSMGEVSLELEGLVRATKRQSWVKSNHDETEHLLIGEVIEYGVPTTSKSMPFDDSIKGLVGFQIEGGR